ncbi:MAG: ABC transporter ATP-binding protein, partial [Alphaproteobacteria bacterium]|nr:ABC transporter ATP-binding protein [Alphaproteobacteria bacterium]
MADLLQVENLEIAFDLLGGRVTAVDKVSFRVPHGRTVALVGESGSGKSVISQAIMSILPKSARILGGSIHYSDRPDGTGTVADIAALPRSSPEMRAIRGGRISIIFQEPMTSLSSLHTIGNQICEALHLHHPDVSPREGRELAAAMLGRVGFPDPEKALKTYPFELSGGLRQRAMIAMALICRPALLIADEPTTALDVTIQAQILKLIKDLQSELGMAVLMITHDLGVVANLADEVVVLYRGRVMEQGTVTDIFTAPSHPYLKGLLHAVPRFNMAEGERLTPLRAISHSTSEYFSAIQAGTRETPRDTPLLRADGLTKSFRIRSAGLFAGAAAAKAAVKAVDDVSFEIRHGECLGLVGESGCGKTTLSKIILGAIRPDTGQVIFDDDGHMTDVLSLPPERRLSFRRKAQFVFQDPFGSLNPRMTVADIVAEPLLIHGIGDHASRMATVRECLGLVGLDVGAMARYPHSFSGGQRQRIGIARALALKPELLILDEPVSALDVSIQAQVLNLLTDLRKELGLTYLFISHNLAVVNYVADRIIVMCAGRIVESADKQALFDRPLHPYTQALLAAVPEPDLAHPLDLHSLMEGRCSDP